MNNLHMYNWKLFLLLYQKSYLPVAGGGAVGEYGGGGSVCSEAIA